MLCWLFLCPKIVCSRPASWDHHFINRNRCLEKLQGLVAKRKDPQTRQLCKPKSLLLCYIALCILLSAFPNVLQFLFPYNYRNVPLMSQGSYRHDRSWNDYKAENSTWSLLSIMLQSQPLNCDSWAKNNALLRSLKKCILINLLGFQNNVFIYINILYNILYINIHKIRNSFKINILKNIFSFFNPI